MPRIEGACTPGCGACCRVLGLPAPAWWPDALLARGIAPPVNASDAFRAFLDARGVVVGAETGALLVPDATSYRRRGDWVYFRQACPQLDGAGRCGLHGTDAYPEVCARYPTVGDDLRLVPECSYTVVED